MRIDVRHEAPKAQPKTRRVNGATVMRPPASVTGIVVHQAATRLPVSRRLLRQADGQWPLAEARRAARMACHAAAMRSGLTVLTRPLQSYVWHANALNRSTLGLEIEGLYPGIAGDERTVPRRLRHRIDRVTDEVVEAARDAIAWLVEEGEREGMRIAWIYAHRQSSPTRPGDPGEELWQRVVLDYAVPKLGLETQPASRWRSHNSKSTGWGRSIPRAWDPLHGRGGYL